MNFGNNGNAFPVIKLEIEGLKQTVLHALSERSLQLDSHVQHALEKFCSEGYIREVVETAARQAIEQATKEAAQRYYMYGDGRHAIHAAVTQRLEEQAKTMAMFDEPRSPAAQED